MPGMKRKSGKGDGSYPGPEAIKAPPAAAKGNPKRLPVTKESATGAKKAGKPKASRKSGGAY